MAALGIRPSPLTRCSRQPRPSCTSAHPMRAFVKAIRALKSLNVASISIESAAYFGHPWIPQGLQPPSSLSRADAVAAWKRHCSRQLSSSRTMAWEEEPPAAAARRAGKAKGRELAVHAQSAPSTSSAAVPAYAVDLQRIDDSRALCPGCGVKMQGRDPRFPGYYQMPSVKSAMDIDEGLELSEEEMANIEGVLEEEVGETDNGGKEENRREGWVAFKANGRKLVPIDDDEIDYLDVEIDDEEMGFEPVGPEFGGEAEREKGRFGDSEDGKGKEDRHEGAQERLVVCARCHALRNYGKVKDERLENLLPDFDFERVVGARLRRAYGRRAVVVMVIDAADFDGSFPRKAAEVLNQAEEAAGTNWKEGQPGNVFRLLVVANKIDLLPKQVSRNRLEQWVRRRARAGGAPRVSGVHLTSASQGWGMRQLVETIKELAGPRGDVWVVGAQNAGKSSLINAMAREESGGRRGQLTEAALPGTTIGVVPLEGLLGQRRRILDTPGLLHPHQMTTRLTREEQKFVQSRKVLKPRTFRVKVGSTIYIGGLARVDLVNAPAESIYLTVWASGYLVCHMGKTENAENVFERHVGERLQPPCDRNRSADLGPWLPRDIPVEGTQWELSSMDVAIAGLGWVAAGLKGRATLRVWTYEEVAVTTREAMVFDMAPLFEKSGFTTVKLPASMEEGKAGSGKSTPRELKEAGGHAEKERRTRDPKQPELTR